MFGIKKTQCLRKADLYCIANQDALCEVLANYGYDCPANPETIMLACIAEGDDFIYDMYDNTQGGDHLPEEDEQGFCSFWMDCLDHVNPTETPKKPILKMKRRHWHIIAVVVIVVIIGLVVYKKVKIKIG